ncbi:MAG: hypothetical protein HC877_22950 [Thioploca sp.]|nr:hypothetical protein [Thioploca sp.]
MNDNQLFALRIFDVDTAVLIAKNWATHAISILDTDRDESSPIPQSRKGLLLHRCYFDDIVRTSRLGLVLATLEDIQAILNFTQYLTKNDKLLIHCGAGISRSTAVATGVLCQHGLTPVKALERVYFIRKMADPNEHIIALMDEALGLKGALRTAFWNVYYASKQ